MGKIRGLHTSPGIYTKPWFDGKKTDTRNNRKGTLPKKGLPGGGSGGGSEKFNGIKFTALSGDTIIGLARRSANQIVLEYSLDNENWSGLTTDNIVTLDNAGDEVFVRGVLSGNNSSQEYTNFIIRGYASVAGDTNYLWNYEDLEQPLSKQCGYNLFSNCTGLVDVSKLVLGTSSTRLAESCYAYMFSYCTSLTTVPQNLLPATNLSGASYCYSYMFYGCKKLTTAPKLPATTLANDCYEGMFRNCTNLTTVHTLPVATLARSCYSYMFNGCSSLKTVPYNMLPTTNLSGASNCYTYMFAGCTSLETAPELPATTLANSCYDTMFSGCTNLITVPEKLPATTLVSGCYNSMFKGCNKLRKAPELPATKLANFCYMNMFSGCTSLMTVQEILPATSLTSYCYSSMFASCTSLETAPELPATALTSYCYSNMFYNCSSLVYIKCLAIRFINTDGSTDSWLAGSVPSGQAAQENGCTFVYHPNANWGTSTVNKIPDGWDRQPAVVE
jgi:hypothetical protein